MTRLIVLPCLDSDEMAAARRRELDIRRHVAAALGRSAVDASLKGIYVTEDDREVVRKDAVQGAILATRSIPPDLALPSGSGPSFAETLVQVTNETTLGAGRRLVERGLRPLALNFANGVVPGGGFLTGAKARKKYSVGPAPSTERCWTIQCTRHTVRIPGPNRPTG